MSETIVGALIGAGATIAAALIAKFPLELGLSSLMRRRANIPDITHTRWVAEWKFQDGSLYVNDTVTIDKWKKNSQFVGYGEATFNDKQYKYSIDGEVGPNRIVVLTYKAEKYPSQGNIGTACMELSNGEDRLDGTWAGRASETLEDGRVIHTVRHGSVVMMKVKDL